MKRVRRVSVQLNEAQKRVVDWQDGSLLVSAGPGSGKTACVVHRIARMVKDGTRPESILATTFTRKAADEMNKRLSSMIDTTKMSIQTMHSYCYRLLREHPNFKNWNVDDKDIARIVLKDVLGYKRMNWRGVDITRVESYISMQRNHVVEPTTAIQQAHSLYADPRYAQAYVAYDEEMLSRRLMTFDDMLYYGVLLLEKDERVLDRERRRYKYIMVDEFQDSNYAQIRLAELVAIPDFNYVVVGDVDQAIYQWRGAMPEFMLDFAEKYGATVVELGTNYRSLPAIVVHAKQCIECNELRLPKTLVANRTNDATVKFVQSTSTDDEARNIREYIQQYDVDGLKLDNVSVLMRMNAQSRAIEEEFSTHKIPYIVLGSVSFYERKEIKNILAYLRLLVDPMDARFGEQSICRPFRYVSKQALDNIRDYARQMPYIDAVDMFVDRGHLGPVVRVELANYTSMMRGLSAEHSPAQVIKTVVESTNYLSYLQAEEGSDTPETSRAGNIGELVASATRFNTVTNFIDYVDTQIKLRKKNQRKNVDGRVQVMTVHKSKGLEFQVVFIIGTNEGVMPHAKGDMEEERRLFYVAMTRAKDDLYVSSITESVDPRGAIISRFVHEAGIIQDLTPEHEGGIVETSSEGNDESTSVVQV